MASSLPEMVRDAASIWCMASSIRARSVCPLLAKPAVSCDLSATCCMVTSSSLATLEISCAARRTPPVAFSLLTYGALLLSGRGRQLRCRGRLIEYRSVAPAPTSALRLSVIRSMEISRAPRFIIGGIVFVCFGIR